MDNIEKLINKLKGVRTFAIVVGAEDKVVMNTIKKATSYDIIDPVLIGNKNKIIEISKKIDFSLKNVKIYNKINENDMMQKATELLEKQNNCILIKGFVSTKLILSQIVKNKKIFDKKILSHVGVMKPKNYNKYIIVTDCGMIINPTLEQKVEIINNAVEFFKNLKINNPKVAILCATEQINFKIKSTLDAAILTQMNRRGQIKDCIIEGPLGLDCAINKKACLDKGIKSEIMGDADILIVPDIHSGNAMGKVISFFDGSYYAGIVLGAKMPIVITSRADNSDSKFFSILCAVLSVNFFE